MRPERYTLSYNPSSARKLRGGSLSLALLVLVALTLLVLARLNHPAVAGVRRELLSVTAPVVDWLGAPVRGGRALLLHKESLFGAFEENKKLRAENETLRRWQSVAEALKAENDALRALASYQPVANISYITARVTGQPPAAYGASLTLNAGEEAGVKPMMPVIDAYGLIGRVVEVGRGTSRVQLLSDSLSRVPVVSASSRVQAIIAGGGAGDETLTLSFFKGDAKAIRAGETIVTTEEAGLIPGGIAIGTVLAEGESALKIKPLRPLAQSEYVRIVAVE